jgi:hypothetical protein
MLKDHIELLVPFLPALYIIVASAICIALLYTKTSTRAVGVLWLLIGIPVYYLTKTGSSFCFLDFEYFENKKKIISFSKNKKIVRFTNRLDFLTM